MPVPEEKLYPAGKLNKWFAVSSVLMTASFFWLIWVDYKRPWQAHQADFFVNKAALAHLDYVTATSDERLNEVAVAEQQWKSAVELDEAENSARRALLKAELAEAELKFKMFDDPYGRLIQVLQVTRDTFERAVGAHGPDHPVTRRAAAEVEAQVNEAEQLRKEKEHWEDRKRELKQQLKQLDERVKLAERRLKDLQQIAEAAAEKDRQYRGVLTDRGLLAGIPIVTKIINAPLLDFTAPKNTPGRFQVNQLVLPDVRQRLNYLESYTTDRCTTCHVAIDDPAFSRETLARKLEQSLPAINDALRRMKPPRPPLDFPPPPIIDSSGTVKLTAGSVTEHWGLLTREQQHEYFEKLLAQVNHYLTLSGRKTIKLAEPLFAHPDLDLYVNVDSPHPMNLMGCTVCHEGNPQETEFVLAAHSPPSHEVEKRWKDEYYVHILGVPNVTFETMAHYWDRPMRWPQYTEASCTKCHTEAADVDRFRGERRGQRINEGRYLFASLGCVNCHNEDSLKDSRKVGPELTHIASKLKPEFVDPWIYFPQKFRPTTRMPHFFEQENNRAESKNQFDPDPVLRTQTEVAAITKYLFAVSKTYVPVKKPEGITGDVERGRELFKQTGCTACHSNLSEFGEEWIAKDLARRTNIPLETARGKARFMTYEEKALYARDHFATDVDTWLNPDRVRFENGGAEPIPTFTRYAPDLSGIGSKVGFDWLYSWLLDPKHYSATTRMPSLRLTPNEAADLAAYLLTLKNDEFVQQTFAMTPERVRMAEELVFGQLVTQRSERASRAVVRDEGGELTEMLVALLEPSFKKEGRSAYDLVSSMSLQEKQLVFLGNKMIGHYGCYACHKIAGFEETTPPGTDLTTWAEKPIAQLDFAFYDHAFHDMRHSKEEIFSHVYPKDAAELNKWSPGENLKEQITHTHAAFAKHKMLNPRIWDREKIKAPYDKLKMPNFYLTAQESDALTTFLLSRIPPRVTRKLAVDYNAGLDGPLARGRNLVRELNCIGCHEVEDNVPTIQQYFRRNVGGKLIFDSLNAPPSLRGEGAKLQHQWFHHFLHNVESLRPWLQVKMPSFNLSGREATTLVEYFAALTRDESQMLARSMAPVEEFKSAEAKKAAEQAAVSTHGQSEAEPGATWFEEDSLRGHAATLKRFAVERKLVRPVEVDALRISREALIEGYRKVWERVGFLKNLYDVDYPFVEPPRALSTEERFAQGTKFFNAMGCLQCHVLGSMLPGPARNTDDFPQMYRLDGVRGEGDHAVAIFNGRPYPIGAEIDGFKLVQAFNKFYESGDVETKAIVEGPKADGSGTERIMLQAPSAPNLSLTYRRLRPTWVHEWMLQPGWIQPGTKMPQNFPGGKSPFEGDPAYPPTSAEQIQLLVDYMYDAGMRGARAPLPKIVAAEPKEFDEDEEFTEEE